MQHLTFWRNVWVNQACVELLPFLQRTEKKKKQGSGFFDTFSILNSGWLRERSKWACFRFIFFMIGTKSHLILRLSQIFWHGVEKKIKCFKTKERRRKRAGQNQTEQFTIPTMKTKVLYKNMTQTSSICTTSNHHHNSKKQPKQHAAPSSQLCDY